MVVRDDQFLIHVGAAVLLAAVLIFGLAFTIGYGYGGGCKSLILPFLTCEVLGTFYPVGGFLTLFGAASLVIGYLVRRRAARAIAVPP